MKEPAVSGRPQHTRTPERRELLLDLHSGDHARRQDKHHFRLCLIANLIVEPAGAVAVTDDCSYAIGNISDLADRLDLCSYRFLVVLIVRFRSKHLPGLFK